MARPRRIDHNLVTQARTAAAAATDITQLRTAQAVLLPAVLQTSLEQTASVLGVGRATVARLQARFRQQVAGGAPPRSRWGGRRRALLRPEAEQAFLSAWRSRAEAGELVVLSPLRAALAQQLGRPVAPSVVYRLVARHRWRKVAPDARHPKSDAAVQAEWKKKRFRRSWRPS
jgi:transposase